MTRRLDAEYQYALPIKRPTYGWLASTDPWDCGTFRCGVCHVVEPRRARETREWRRHEDAAW